MHEIEELVESRISFGANFGKGIDSLIATKGEMSQENNSEGKLVWGISEMFSANNIFNIITKIITKID